LQLLLLALGVFLFDQATKVYIIKNMELGQSIPVIKEFFHITYIKNPGAAFGILQHQTGLFVAIAILLVVAVLFYYPRLPQGYPLLRFGIGLQVGGAVGNLLDRVRTGYVTDFFDFRVFPIFNIADIAIVVGVGLLFIEIVRMPEDDKA
jgi:signal peptidase II